MGNLEKRRRVVITGLGMVAPNGIGKEEFWSALVGGKSGVTKITRFDASSYPYRIAGEVKEFDPLDFMERKVARKSARFTQFALAAARLAVSDSGLVFAESNTHRTGVFLGDSVGGLEELEREVAVFQEKGITRVSPLGPVKFFSHAAASRLALELSVKGPVVTLSTGCPAGITAIAFAVREIEQGNIDIAIVGGTDAPISPTTVAAFWASGGLTSDYNDVPEKASRPFDNRRSGYVLSEGAGMVILEELGHASSRSANLYGEVSGYALTNDAVNLYDIDPSGDGLLWSMRRALADARLIPQEIEYISAHGPSIVLTDRAETTAIKRLFGEYAFRVPISSIKSMIGQPLGATPMLQLASCLLTFRDHILPPTINYEVPDPACDLDYVPNRARTKTVETALINAHGYGGINASLVVRKISQETRILN